MKHLAVFYFEKQKEKKIKCIVLIILVKLLNIPMPYSSQL